MNAGRRLEAVPGIWGRCLELVDTAAPPHCPLAPNSGRNAGFRAAAARVFVAPPTMTPWSGAKRLSQALAVKHRSGAVHQESGSAESGSGRADSTRISSEALI